MKLPAPLLCCLALCLTLPSCASMTKQNQLLAEHELQTAKMQQNELLLEYQLRQAEELNEVILTLAQEVSKLSTSFEKVKTNLGKPDSATPKNTLPATPVKAKAPKIKPGLQAIKPEKAVLGRVEWAKVDQLGQYLKARIDTGAKSSSLHATNVQFFERDGEKWVKFDIDIHGKTQATQASSISLESPLVRTVRIKQASSTENDERAVIKLMVEVGELKDETEFTLTDRASMNYPILLGRNFLKDVVIVDVAKVFTRKRITPPSTNLRKSK